MMHRIQGHSKSRAKVQATLFAVCASGLLLSARVQAQPEDKSQPVAVIAPVQIAPVAEVAGIGLGAERQKDKSQTSFQVVPVADVAGIGANVGDAARREAALARIEAGSLSPEEAWQKGDLTYANICDFFEHPTDAWIIHVQEKDNGLHYALAALLIAHEADKLKDLSKIPSYTRLWLADYFYDSRDEQCVPILQSVIADAKFPLTGENPLPFQAVERLAWYYRLVGNPDKSADTWKLVANLDSDHSWQSRDGFSLLLEARFDADPNDVSALQLLKSSLDDDDPVTNTSLRNVADIMLKRGEVDQCVSLLNDPQVASNSHEDVRLLALGLKGKVAMLQGRESEALKNFESCKKMIDVSSADAQHLATVQEVVQVGIETLDLLNGKDIVVRHDSLRLNPQSNPSGAFDILSLGKPDIIIVATDPKVTIQSTDWQLKPGEFCFSRTAYITLPPDYKPGDLSISIGEANKEAVHLPVQVQREEQSGEEDSDIW